MGCLKLLYTVIPNKRKCFTSPRPKQKKRKERALLTIINFSVSQEDRVVVKIIKSFLIIIMIKSYD